MRAHDTILHVVVEFLTPGLGPHRARVYGPYPSKEAAENAITSREVNFSRATAALKVVELERS